MSFGFSRITAVLLAMASLLAAQGEIGSVNGVVVDGRSGRPVAGAVVEVEGQEGPVAHSDQNGKFSVTLPPGTYHLKISAPDYLIVNLSEVVVNSGEDTPVSIVLSSRSEVTSVEVVERAASAGATAEFILQERRLAAAVLEGLSREELAAGTASDAAGALQQVTGVSVVGDGYVFVRGLGERYSATQLNGSLIPTTEPEKRVVPLDLFPVGLIDHVKIAKSYTPDLPAEFSGGLVQVGTVEFPTEGHFSISYKSGFNTQLGFGPFLTYPGGAGDFFGYGAGARAIPSIIPRNVRVVPGTFSPAELQKFGQAFSNNWEPQKKNWARPASDWSASGGGVWGRLGLVGTVSLSNKLQLQNESQRYLRQGAGAPVIFTEYPDYREYTEAARLGAAFNAAVRLTPSNKIIFRNTYTHDAEKSVRRLAGYDGGVGNYLAAERLRFIERALQASSIEGEHSLAALHDSLLRWQFTYSRSNRDEPDLREVFRNLLPDGRYIFAGTSTSGLRFFSALDDRIYEPQLDFSLPFFKGRFTGLSKAGVRAVFRGRDFQARRFLFQLSRNTVDLFLPSNQLFAPENIRPDGFQLFEYTRGTDAYNASMNIYAGYGMIDLGLGARLRLVAGIRIEDAEQTVTTRDNLSANMMPIKARLRNPDPAPAANLIYALSPRQNLRLAYSRTLARPDFRELSPFDFANTLGGFITAGNPKLKRAIINNYDARWEWFSSGNQMLAVSAFAKTFINPIEQVIVPSNDLRQTFVNAKGARNMGFEFEVRHSLGNVWERLRDFGISSNFTVVDSSIDLNPEDAAILTSQSRPLLGQSRYIGNLVVFWRRTSWRSSAQFNANYVSRRLSDAGTFGLPDIYQEPNTFLDFSYQYTLGGSRRWALRFEAENLGNNNFRWTQGNIVHRSFRLGRTFQVGATYSFF